MSVGCQEGGLGLLVIRDRKGLFRVVRGPCVLAQVGPARCRRVWPEAPEKSGEPSPGQIPKTVDEVDAVVPLEVGLDQDPVLDQIEVFSSGATGFGTGSGVAVISL